MTATSQAGQHTHIVLSLVMMLVQKVMFECKSTLNVERSCRVRCVACGNASLKYIATDCSHYTNICTIISLLYTPRLHIST